MSVHDADEWVDIEYPPLDADALYCVDSPLPIDWSRFLETLAPQDRARVVVLDDADKRADRRRAFHIVTIEPR